MEKSNMNLYAQYSQKKYIKTIDKNYIKIQMIRMIKNFI